MSQPAKKNRGIEYAPGIKGKYLYRVREAYVAGPAAILVRGRRVGALKLDLILRGLALLPEHAGRRPAGHVLRLRGQLNYRVLHDLCRDPERFTDDALHSAEDDTAIIEKKRTWVREQLQVLEQLKLVERSTDPQGRRPDITVLCDRGDGEPLDDPGASASTNDGYLTISGGVISSDYYRDWGAPEVVAYLCAMTADRFALHRSSKGSDKLSQPGSATWFRQADWFNSRNPNLSRPKGHTSYPFSTTTIQRGLRSLCDQGLIEARLRTTDPVTGQRFVSGPRKIYKNRFADERQAEVIDLALHVAAS